MATYIHPCFLISSPPPSASFETHPIQQTTSPPSYNLHIRLHCHTIHHVFYVTHPNSPLYISHHTQTHTPYLIYLDNRPQLQPALITVLSNWGIPDIHQRYILHSTVNQLHSINASLPSPFSLRVNVLCHRFYCPNMNLFTQWCTMRCLQIPITEGPYPNNDEMAPESGPTNDGMTPASESAIKSMVVRQKMKKGGVDQESTCPICLEDFLEGSLTGSLPCSHMFHEECITNWLRRSHNCPLCRFEVPATISTE